MALTAGRTLKRRDGVLFGGPMAASVKIFAGAMVALDSSGYLRPAREEETDSVVGISLSEYDNTDGDAGDVYAQVEVGIFRVDNTSSAVTKAHKGHACYAVDDAAVDIDNNAGARCQAGTVVDVDSDGVWVHFGAPRCVTVPGAPYVAQDILVFDGTTWTRLAKGSDGQVLKMVSGAVAWAADAT